MTDNKAIEIQQQVRQNALKLQEEVANIKSFEKEMKRKEEEMLRKSQENYQINQSEVPIRSNIDEFQKFHTIEKSINESTKKMKLMNIENNNNTQEVMSDTEKKKLADNLKEKGNSFVKSKDYESAIKMYTSAIEILEDAVYYSNRSQCYLSMERYSESISDATSAIKLDRKFSKAYYRRMVAHEKLEEDLKALQNCQEWMNALPDDQLAKNSYDRIHNKLIEIAQMKEKEKIKWSRLPNVTNFIEKSPHLQSKKPLKKITVRAKRSHSPIPDEVIDKIFNNNTGEQFPETPTDSKLFKSNFLENSYTKPKSSPTSTNVGEKAMFNELNEKLKASYTKKERIPTLEELEAIESNLIVLPSTGPQFHATWKELSEELKFLYLRNIAGNNLSIGKLIGAQLDSGMLSDIIFVIHKYFMQYNISYLQLLHELSKNSELSVLGMFLENDDKKRLNELIESSQQDNGGENNDENNMIQQIKENFQI